MTLELLNKIYEENNIPKDALLMSDSGWECSASDMDGVFYSKEHNTVFITQGSWSEVAHGYNNDPGDCVLIYVPDKDLNGFVNMYTMGILDYDYDEPIIEELKISTTLRRKLIEELHNTNQSDMRGKNCNTCKCNTCKNNDDELSGECYECIKGIFDHYEPQETDFPQVEDIDSTVESFKRTMDNVDKLMSEERCED